MDITKEEEQRSEFRDILLSLAVSQIADIPNTGSSP